MLQVRFLCGLMLGELWKQTPAVMLHIHPRCLRQRAGSSPGQSFALSWPAAGTLGIAQPTRGVLGQVRAGVFQIMER